MIFASLCAATLAGLIVALSEPQIDEDLFDLCYPMDGDEQLARERRKRNARLQAQILDSRMEVLVDNYSMHSGA
jgi:hypothetical protein